MQSLIHYAKPLSPLQIVLLGLYIYSGQKFGKYPYNTRPMESTPLLQPKSGI